MTPQAEPEVGETGSENITSLGIVARNAPRWQRVTVICDISRFAKPDAIVQLVLDAMPQRRAQPSQPERLSADVGVDGDIVHQRLLDALLDHLLELINDHVAECLRAMLALDNCRRVIDLDRVRHVRKEGDGFIFRVAHSEGEVRSEDI